jgi:hypothetical protein
MEEKVSNMDDKFSKNIKILKSKTIIVEMKSSINQIKSSVETNTNRLDQAEELPGTGDKIEEMLYLESKVSFKREVYSYIFPY